MGWLKCIFPAAASPARLIFPKRQSGAEEPHAKERAGLGLCIAFWFGGDPRRASSDRIRSGSTSYALVLAPSATRFEAALTNPLPFGFDAAGGFRASVAVSPHSAIFRSAA